MHPSVASGFAISLLVAPALAQTGRSVALNASPNLGAVSSYTANYPASAAGRVGAYGMTLPFASAVPLVLPGITSNGLVRIDLANILVQGLWLLDGTGSFTWTVPVPNAPVFQGLSFDVQTLDVDVAVTDFAWGDNELSLTIGPATIAVAPNMLWIPAGTFQMGSNAPSVSPYFNQSQSQPAHPVTITRPFWIGKYEVTQASYQAVMGANPSFAVGPLLPVENVSWLQAITYCAALTAAETASGRVPAGYQYRLPTEAEWEYCYRAGAATEYWTGQTLECGQENFSYSYHSNANCLAGPLGQSSTNVGSYPANPWGLHDVAGNVSEWCLDGWELSPNYPSSAVSDPYVTGSPFRVFRGGSWVDSSARCRAAYRSDYLSGGGFVPTGFRVVLAPIMQFP